MARCDRHRCIIDLDCHGLLVGVAHEAYLRGDRVASSVRALEPFDTWTDVLADVTRHLDVMHHPELPFA